MTQEEYRRLVASDQVKQEKPAERKEDDPQLPTRSYSLDDFLPILVELLAPKRHLTAAPTFTPRTLLEAIQFMDDGADIRVYFYVNGAWRYAALT